MWRCWRLLEGTVENQFRRGRDSGPQTGESWWRTPERIHDVARNPSKTARARLLVVYIAEEGKAATVPIK
jgi:hypothetical protein